MAERVSVDKVASDVLSYVMSQGGEVEAEPGRLLARLTDATGYTYSQVSLAVRYLEDVGFLYVERLSDTTRRQHNMLVMVRVVE